jgi:hypothetical protein
VRQIEDRALGKLAAAVQTRTKGSDPFVRH